MKKCSKCEIEKPLEEFHKRSLSKDGRQLFFTRRVTEADIWLLTSGEEIPGVSR